MSLYLMLIRKMAELIDLFTTQVWVKKTMPKLPNFVIQSEQIVTYFVESPWWETKTKFVFCKF